MCIRVSLFLAILFLSTNLLAQEVSGPYAKVLVGGQVIDGYDFRSSVGNNFIEADTEFDPGYVAALAGGYRFNESFGLELEYSRRVNGIDQVNVRNGSFLSAGDIKSSSLMLNAIYYITAFDYVNPYLGFGLGLMSDLEYEVEIQNFGTGHQNDGDAFAIQGLLGLEVPVNRNFRFFFEGRIFTGSSPDVTNGQSTYNIAYDNAAFLGGLVYIFSLE